MPNRIVLVLNSYIITCENSLNTKVLLKIIFSHQRYRCNAYTLKKILYLHFYIKFSHHNCLSRKKKNQTVISRGKTINRTDTSVGLKK